MNLTRKEIHIFPFYSDYDGVVKFEHFNVKDEEALIRGLHLKKERLSNKDVVLYVKGKKIQGDIFYWKTVSDDIDDVFKKGLKLTEEGLGYKQPCEIFSVQKKN